MRQSMPKCEFEQITPGCHNVRTYLKTHLQRVREDFDSVMQYEPTSWPPLLDLDRLVKLSDGLFIYASTAVQYIGDGNALPQTKLQAILKMHNGLDPLYTQVVNDAQASDNFHTVMGCLLYLQTPITIRHLSWLLQLDICNIRIALDRCHSILFVPLVDDEPIRPYHASLRDFLTSQERSQDLFFAPTTYHAIILIQCLKDINNARSRDVWPLAHACKEWRYHGCLLLLEATASQRFRDDIETEMKQIDSKWIDFWIRKLGETASDYLEIGLPKARPKVHQTLYRKLKDIDVIFKKVIPLFCGVEDFGHADNGLYKGVCGRQLREIKIVNTDIIIPIFGWIGCGTSTFINIAAGLDVVNVSHGLAQETTEIQAIPLRHPKDPGRRVVLLDIPGYLDEVNGNNFWWERMEYWFRSFSNGKSKSGCIFLHDVGRRINVMNLWANRIPMNLAVATTHWDRVHPDEGERREKNLPMSFRSRMFRFHCTYHSAWEIIGSIIDKDLGTSTGSSLGRTTDSKGKLNGDAHGGVDEKYSSLAKFAQSFKLPRWLG